MPEGDTVHRAARLLHAALAGSALTRSDLRVPRFAIVDLRGQVVTEVIAVGKHLLVRTDRGVTGHSHLGMDGYWRITKPNDRLLGPHHQIRAILETTESRAVGSRLRILEALPSSEEQQILGSLGPDPLGPSWDLKEGVRRMRAKPRVTISDALLDQTIIAGFGNIYRNEICFLRGYNPWRLVGRCDVEATLRLGKKVIEANRTHAGHVTTGDSRAGRSRYVYGRRGEPCRRCRTPISKRDAPEDRITYWCPFCQPEDR